MRYEAIIFDLDGTIIDTEEIWKIATQQFIINKGITLSHETIHRIKEKIRGLALHGSCTVIKEELNLKEPVEELVQQKMAIANYYYRKGVNFIPGFLDFYKKIIDLHLKTGIATNADDEILESTKAVLPLEKLFGKHI